LKKEGITLSKYLKKAENTEGVLVVAMIKQQQADTFVWAI
jgi:hypothetical protein